MVSLIDDLLEKEELSYDEMQMLAAHQDVSVRIALSQRRDLRPEVLYYLAEDDHIEVRQAIAQNPTTPRQADLLLARDDAEDVRLYLTEKIAKLAPGTSAEDLDKIKSLTYEALMVLSQDQATKVRQILSETLKDMIDAPRELIGRLARDIELVVAGPVLQYSPVLTDEDLLEIISTSHADGALNAISKRHTVSELVTEAVIATREESAIADLLANDQAQIREETLDMLAEQGSSVLSWHKPLSHRPKLSLKAASRMAQYLAENLLEHLQNREDLPDDVISSVKEEVQKRIDQANAQDDVADHEEEGDPFDEIEKMHQNAELAAAQVEDWLKASKELHVLSALAVMAEMRRVKVKKIVSSQSGKGIMALAWRAGLEAKFGETLQLDLAKVPLNMLFQATEDGQYPLDEEELSWHLEMFGDD